MASHAVAIGVVHAVSGTSSVARATVAGTARALLGTSVALSYICRLLHVFIPTDADGRGNMALEEGGAAASTSFDELDTYIYHLRGWTVAPMLIGLSLGRDKAVVFLLFEDGSLSAGCFPQSFSWTCIVCLSSSSSSRWAELSLPIYELA